MVSVRVPKSKAREYRMFINKCVANHLELNDVKLRDTKVQADSTKFHDIMDTINKILKKEKK